MRILTIAASFLLACTNPSLPARSRDGPPEKAADRQRLWSTAYAMPVVTTSEQSGSFSIVECKDKHVYIGTARWRSPITRVASDCKTGRSSRAT